MSTNFADEGADAHHKLSDTLEGAKTNKSRTAERRSSIKRVSDMLFEGDIITPAVEHTRTTIRYVYLDLEKLFTQLVNLYTVWFQSHWDKFQAFATLNGFNQTQSPVLGFTRIYISAWLFDLYSTIRESIEKVDHDGFVAYYAHERPRSSFRYDHYLSRLNASIRPTNISLISRECMFVPLLRIDSRNRTTNPYTIRNFNYQPKIMKGINDIMSSRSLCMLTPLSNDPLGSAAWLFDSHVDRNRTSFYAWFPLNGNYSDDDITVAFILGDSCTPHLGPVQYDEWQWYPNYQKGNHTVDPYTFPRVTPRTTHGNAEVPVLEEQLGLIFPDHYSTDPRIIRKMNVGIFKYSFRETDFPVPMEEIEVDETTPAAPLQTQEGPSSTQIVVHTDQPASEDEEDPTSPLGKRSKSGKKKKVSRPKPVQYPNPFKVDRFRILIYLYHSKVAVKNYQTTRLAALNQYLST